MSFGSGAGAADGYETEDAEGNIRVGSGRGSDTAGLQELYHRRHDPMAPGSGPSLGGNDEPSGSGGVDPSQPISGAKGQENARVSGPQGSGGMMGRPSLSQAFSYNAGGRYTPTQNAVRTAIGMIPGGGAVQMLMAGGAALNDMYGPAEGFGQIEPGDPNLHDPDYGNTEPMVVQKKRVASTQMASAQGRSAAAGAKPNIATSVGGSKDSSPTRTRPAAGGRSTIMTSPFGDLRQASTAKKMLLGA